MQHLKRGDCWQIAEQQTTTLPEHRYKEQARPPAGSDAVRKVGSEMSEQNYTQPQRDVIERMLIADFKTRNAMNSYPKPGQTGQYRKECIEGMTAAAKVLLDEALGPVTEDEWYLFSERVPTQGGYMDMVLPAGATKLLSARRARLLPESKRDEEAPEYALDHQRCPHRWAVKHDKATMESVVYCELCGWEYSRTALVRKAGQQ